MRDGTILTMKSYLIKITMALLVSVALLYPTNAKAEIATDKAAHFGVSFAMNTTLYGLYKKMFRMSDDEKWNALLLSAFTALSIGFTKEVMDVVSNPDPRARFDTGDMSANTAGVALSTGVILVFDF